MEGDKAAEDISSNDGRDVEVDSSSIAKDVDNVENCSSQMVKVPSEVSSSVDVEHSPERKSNEANAVDHNPPCIILQEADPSGNGPKDVCVQQEQMHRRKSPLTVQEWVDHLPIKPKINEKDCDDSLGSKDLDNLALTDTLPHEEKKSLIAQKLSREASVQSSSSLDSILDSRRPDPVEVLLNLGFGGVPGVDMNNCRIPKRFLVPSKCKGGDWNEFLKRELLQAQNFECASLGFRGLSGPSYRRPSAIVANIMEKLRERTTPHHPVKTRFSSVARRVLNEKSVLNKLVSPSQSVLSPDSRKFLECQGKISPEVPRRRIIFGQKSFAFGNDGEFIEVESPTKVPDKESAASVGSSSVESDFEEGKMNSATIPSPDVMLKIRRSSLQRQKKVEEVELGDLELDLMKNDRRTNESSRSSGDDNKYSKEDKKIPLRFVSASNLRQLTEEDLSKTSEEIKMEVEEEIKTLSQKIQNASSVELSSILLQMKELRTRLENSS
ncbi:UNVERIFIED_CONTAM: hypothetical protein PYX00_001558 [Menopon gallinae]|uniref:ITPR-interacting domain-containing protein n=1 Tax=Menopon gallinae TaxID=328185 RepID=A0AAW2IDG4_9NEOP